MARGKLGGTKAKIRGKVGTDIYQVKRNEDGSLVQAVYLQNLTPKYTNTRKQAVNRCCMGQVERMWHLLPQIIKDSFAQVPMGTLSFQRFSKLNYPLIRTDFEKHYESGNDFSWVPKRQLNAPVGPWLLTHGTLSEITWAEVHSSNYWNNSFEVTFQKSFPKPTYGDFLSNFGLNKNDRLILSIFRQELSDLNQYVDTWTFNPRTDYNESSRWNWDLESRPFDTDCPYLQTSGISLYGDRFFWGLDTQDYPRQIKVLCFAMFVARDTDSGTIFSTSRFHWAQSSGDYGYHRWTPADVFSSWLNP